MDTPYIFTVYKKAADMTKKPLTNRQKEILTFISDHIDSEGFPPTRNDLSKHFGFRSPNAAESHLRALEHKGVIRIEAGRSRGITLTSLSLSNLPPLNALHTPLPLVGRVAAGSPILAQENIENEYRVDPSLFSSRPHYLLRVEGNSMLNAGILDGDLLAVHRTPEAQNGQIVVARLDDEVTVKRFKRNGHQVSLLPENPDFRPILVDLRRQSLVIEGRAVGVIRPRMDS
jgi:repressor LexA